MKTKKQAQAQQNRTALRVEEETTYRWATESLAAINDDNAQRTYLHDDEQLRRGVLNGSIPSAVVDSGATSSVGTPTDPFAKTSRHSNKVFRLPNGATEEAREIGELATNVRTPARDVHITPGITKTSLLSTAKFSDAGYTTIFDGDQVNIYHQHNTVITVSHAAIIRGWREPGKSKLFRIPLVPVIRNNNTETILVKQPPSEYLPARPPPQGAVFNVYELKTQPELVRYLHSSAGFPTKPMWLHAVKNRQYASLPGLTPEAIAKHFPESKKTLKGHARKTKSGQRSTKRMPGWEDNLIHEHKANTEAELTRPTTKERNIFVQIYNVKGDEAILKMYMDQTGRFPKKLSRGNQYGMVLVELDSNTILVEGMKDRTSGEMIRAYQHLVDRLKTAGIQPKHHILDNKCSMDFKATIAKNHMTYQLVPPNAHRRNIAEKAI